ncbi:MAG TPA: glycerol-3-phosphate 1-O-acyltransferase PlsY [Patescibacteria group bacterium]|nr:glycerol-3-phosphate 1-O-acyltransferase PlsY [Patescibacteria group bacterium]
MLPLFLIFLSYVFGSIPTGFIVAKKNNVDIRKVGSGNIGATNILRTFGLKFAVPVALFDFLKGLVPTLLASLLGFDQISIGLVALAAIVGHVFPLFLKFRGGRGVATYGGTLFVILGIKYIVIIFVIWFAILILTKLMSLTNLLLSLAIPILVFCLIHNTFYALYTIAGALFIWWTHRPNIKRLLEGSEKRLNLTK